MSLNYERVIGKKKRVLLGLGICPTFTTNNAVIAFPITISMIIDPLENHHLEYGLGIEPRIYYDADYPYKQWSHHLIIPIMYRYKKNRGY